MKLVCLLFFLIPLVNIAQELVYTPNRKLDKTVDNMYYNTEFIFIKNVSNQAVNLDFELIDNNLKPEWSATICTNRQCSNNIPKSGSLGSINPNNEAYISFNFSANETPGSGQARFLITSPDDKALHDTVTFSYTVTDDGKIQARPWADLRYAQGVLTVILENPNSESVMRIFNLEGKPLFDGELSPITSVPLRDFGSGIYLVAITDEKGRTIRKKIVNTHNF